MAKSGEEIIGGDKVATDQDDVKDQCKRHGEMSEEAKIDDDSMELDNSGNREEKPVEETVELASRAVAPTERRLRTPERPQAQKRRSTGTAGESVQKRLITDTGDVMDDDDDDHISDQEENNDMQFEDDSRPSGPGGAGGADDSDAMISVLTSLNIIDITEVFSPPRVVKQGEKLGLRSGSSMADGMEL